MVNLQRPLNLTSRTHIHVMRTLPFFRHISDERKVGIKGQEWISKNTCHYILYFLLKKKTFTVESLKPKEKMAKANSVSFKEHKWPVNENSNAYEWYFAESEPLFTKCHQLTTTEWPFNLLQLFKWMTSLRWTLFIHALVVLLHSIQTLQSDSVPGSYTHYHADR